ncbi:uncharacterized protein LOC110844203 [Folsomia candida]|uniref:uncharacterized protein LOC110844203 n=1 Tax=Folsomia candida TaxID=158441 RepID=UPI000B8FE0AF|nr:uncharacterized protein LOC110844203 [Folsomia candida]
MSRGQVKCMSIDLKLLEKAESDKHMDATSNGLCKTTKSDKWSSSDKEKWLKEIHESDANLRELMLRNLEREGSFRCSSPTNFFFQEKTNDDLDTLPDRVEENKNDDPDFYGYQNDRQNSTDSTSLGWNNIDNVHNDFWDELWKHRIIIKSQENANVNQPEESYEEFLENIRYTRNCSEETEVIDQSALENDKMLVDEDDDDDDEIIWLT